MRNRDRRTTDVFTGRSVIKEDLIGHTYPEVLTGKCRLLFVENQGDKDLVSVISPYIDQTTDRHEQPPKVTTDVIEKYAPKGSPYAMQSFRYVNRGTQIAYTIAGGVVYEERVQETEEDVRMVDESLAKPKTKAIVKGKKKVVTKIPTDDRLPFAVIEVGQNQFPAWVIHLHRYDRKLPEQHLEIENKNGLALYFKKSEKLDKPFLPIIRAAFEALSKLSPDKANEIKVSVRLHITGYSSRASIGERQDATLEKFDFLASCLQKEGVNLYGENGLGVLWGVAAYAEKYWMDQTLENDFMRTNDGTTGRDKMDKVMQLVFGLAGIEIPQ